ncbi:MAG: hypothetical protein Q9163_001080 [Psora crenata]
MATDVVLDTTMGTITIELYNHHAPKTCKNFATLTQRGYYNNVIFHRIIPNFMLQTGDPTGTGRGGTSIYGEKFEDEINTSLKHTGAGVLSMANSGPNTNGSQFFITLAPTPWLDGKHTIFGRVKSGLRVVQRMGLVKTGAEDRPVDEVKIRSARVVEGGDAVVAYGYFMPSSGKDSLLLSHPPSTTPFGFTHHGEAMESLSETAWDVVLYGTGFSQSLLALALSRSGKNILHLDHNNYYGGGEAALTLEEAMSWADNVQVNPTGSPFREATIQELQHNGPGPSRLGPSRAYSLTLSPQLIYTRSNIIPALVSSKVYRQLEFLAVGSWWIYDVRDKEFEKEGESRQVTMQNGYLKKIPGGREDIFADKSIDLRSSRSLMRFLQLAADAGAYTKVLEEWASRPFSEYLSSQFKIPEKLQAPLFALTMSLNPPLQTTTAYALPRIHRHLTSIGIFGPGFGAVIPKWGGLAEIAQVACRAGAVGGGVYVLGQGIKNIEHPHSQAKGTQATDKNATPGIQLDNGEAIQASLVVGCPRDLAPGTEKQTCSVEMIYRSISIVSSPMTQLFHTAGEGAPPPACSVVIFPSGTLTDREEPPITDHPPVYLMVHSIDTGECPAGQCVIYAQTRPSVSTQVTSFHLLSLAITKLLNGLDEEPNPQVLWCLQYVQQIPQPQSTAMTTHPHIVTIPEAAPSFVLEDDVLQNVRAVWERVVGDEKGDGFMTFADRRDVANDEIDEDDTAL